MFVMGSFGPRLLLSLGLSLGTYAGTSGVIDEIVVIVQSTYNGIPADILNLLNLAGFGHGFSIILGSLVTKGVLTAGRAFINKAATV